MQLKQVISNRYGVIWYITEKRKEKCLLNAAEKLKRNDNARIIFWSGACTRALHTTWLILG